MMKLGTIGAFGFADFHPPEVIGLYAKAGCTLVQAYRNRATPVPERDIVATCRDLGVEIESLHAHFGDDMDPSSPDESLRAKTIDLYKAEADYCRHLGAKMLVVHPSPPNVPAGDLEKRYAQLRRSFADFARIGEQMDVIFAFENMPPYHPVGADVGRLVREVAAAASPRVIFLLDFGHAHMTCGIAEAVQLAGPHLAATHVHDNDGVNDTHQLPYRGNLPWDRCREALHAVGYDGVFMLEVFEQAADLRRLLNDRWGADIRSILNNGRS